MPTLILHKTTITTITKITTTTTTTTTIIIIIMIIIIIIICNIRIVSILIKEAPCEYQKLNDKKKTN